MVTRDIDSVAFLNGFQRLVIDFANEHGISLASQFSSVEEFKRFVVALAFKMLTDLGLSTQEAYDIVFGEGRYDAMVEKVWASVQEGAE